MGYEVFLNAGADGAIDIVAIDPEGCVKFYDVKTYHVEHRGGRAKSDTQKDLGVEYIWFEPETRTLGFTVTEVRQKALARKNIYRLYGRKNCED